MPEALAVHRPTTALPPRQTVLLVDDQPENLELLGDLLEPHYRVKVANSGRRALHLLETGPAPDLVLLDVNMPDLDGYGVLRALRELPGLEQLPVIFVTGRDEQDDETTGLQLGAADYITKPIHPGVVLARVRNQMELQAAKAQLRRHNEALQEEVALRLYDFHLVQEVSIRALATLGEARDNETGNHLHRTQRYIECLGHHLRDHPRFRDGLAHGQLDMIVKAAPLHDIGKIGVPDRVLNKPGPLDAEEWTLMRQHPNLGGHALQKAIDEAQGMMGLRPGGGGDQPKGERPLGFLEMARDVSLYHHEKWDGSGYPNGLAGDAIPLCARLMALADVYDALISRRVYKPPFSSEQVRSILLDGRGTHFDPDLVDAFLVLEPEFQRIATRFADHPDGG